MRTKGHLPIYGIGFLLVLSAAMCAQQTGLSNGDFESDRAGDAPKGWYIPKPCLDAGYVLEVTEAFAATGKHSAALRNGGEHAQMFGNCMQSIDASPFHGKRVRFSAAVRCEPADGEGRAQLWLRVDRPDKQMGFFDNMGDRPVRSTEWKRYEIVGDIADDAQDIALGMMLLGRGTAMLDDVALEVVASDVPATGVTAPMGQPGLSVVLYAAKGVVMHDSDSATLRFPMPLAYRDQTPVTFRLQVEPADLDVHIGITSDSGPNHVLQLEFRNVKERANLSIRYESVVLVEPSSFDSVPPHAAFPSTWPSEAKPWLAATWCCDAADPRIQAIGAEIKGASKDVNAVIEGVLKRSQEIFGKVDGHLHNLTAVEALDKQGSCTSCANLVAALMRASGVPARVVAGYPLWSGPLQTHYIVEAFLPSYGWYPVESTMGQAPWPNCQQLAVSIVPIEHEAEPLARQRGCVAGAVPFMTLTEYGPDSPIALQGTLKPSCDHAGEQLHPIKADAAEWQAAESWARERWARWMESKPEIRAGKVEFGPARDALTAKTLAELRSELR